ncbi:MAG TPA: hypothetical protein VKY57_07095 [Chitinispirillaceae bacterium]|nr:hypothetical protein [Chitinispirillaceae bacterium]
MPFGDGTGPMGFGPRRGRGRHRRFWCNSGSGMFSFRRRNNWLFGITSSLLVALLKDLGNPRGFLRSFTCGSFPLNKNRSNNKSSRTVRDTEYEIVNQNDSKKERKEAGFESVHDLPDRIHKK